MTKVNCSTPWERSCTLSHLDKHLPFFFFLKKMYSTLSSIFYREREKGAFHIGWPIGARIKPSRSFVSALRLPSTKYDAHVRKQKNASTFQGSHVTPARRKHGPADLIASSY
jgi:hypothetical protein